MTILVHITYTVNPAFDVLDPKSKRLKTDYYYYISNDRKHDSLFVQHCLTLHWAGLKDSGVLPVRHIIWSDGCSAQFRCAMAWFFVARYLSLIACDELPGGCHLDWHFWGSGHGKGPHDGAGACLKQSVRKEQLKQDSQRLHDAPDAVSYLNQTTNVPHAAYPGARRLVHRHFQLIGALEVSRMHPKVCKTMIGSRSMHSIRSVSRQNNCLLESWDFSCFCDVCVHGVSGICPNRDYASLWQLVTLVPVTVAEVVQEEEDLDDLDWALVHGTKDLAADLEVGDHFTVVADPDDPHAHGANLFVLICTKAMYVVEDETMTDSWKVVVDKGNEVIDGLYYHQSGPKENSYQLMGAAGPARILSHLVAAHKFAMTLMTHKQKAKRSVYKLSNAALTKIEDAVQERALMEEQELDGSDSTKESNLDGNGEATSNDSSDL